jgi:hypothetical protein
MPMVPPTAITATMPTIGSWTSALPEPTLAHRDGDLMKVTFWEWLKFAQPEPPAA